MKKENNKMILRRYREMCLDRCARNYNRDSIRKMERYAYWAGKARVIEIFLHRLIREEK